MEAEFVKTAFILIAGVLMWAMTHANLKTTDRTQKK